MKNNSYWKDRANERMADYHKSSDETIGKINNAYDKAIEDINKEINKIFFKFQTDSGLSIEEAKALLNSKISEKKLESIRAKIAYIEDKDLKQYLMAQLNAKAYNARMTRLEALKESIYINTKKAAEVELKQSELGYINNINKAYYKNIYDIQKGTGVVTEFATMPVSTIEEILKNNWSGKHYSERIWGNSEVLATKIEEVITSGLMSGKSSRKMATELAELSQYGKMAAERLVRTETTYVTNMAELESYKKTDIEKYIFVATLDLRTSDECRKMDGKIIEVDKGVPGENLPPLHPWCRSTTRAYFEGMTRRRRARDPETGKNYIIEDMNYDEWYQKCVVDKYGEQKAETFQKMIKNKASDKKQHSKYKEILGKDVPKSFEDFQNLKYNGSNEYVELKNLYREVNWQVKAKQNTISGSVHKVDSKGMCNSVFDNYKDGKLVSRRYYGRTGKPRLDIDFTDHKNPAVHKIVPHAHSWNFKDVQYYGVDPSLQGREKHGRELSKAEYIANKEVIKKVK